MKKLISIALPFVLIACNKAESPDPSTAPSTSASAGSQPTPAASGTPSGSAQTSGVGTWKIDLASLDPSVTEADKAEEAKFRMELKADGSYQISMAQPIGSGTWKLEGNSIVMKPNDSAVPPKIEVAGDGKSLISTQSGGSGKPDVKTTLVPA
jgi:hypothetical protein